MRLVCKISDMRRKNNRMTQNELFEKTGIDVTTISAYENNRKIPNIITAWKIAKALNCQVDDLYEEIE